MKSRIVKSAGFFLASCIFASCSARPAPAQDIGNVGLRNSNNIVFSSQAAPAVTPNSGSPTCVASPGNPCAINNLGQNVFYLIYTTAGTGVNNLTGMDIRLEGSNDGVNFFPISDDATDVLGGEVYACGSYAVVRANLVNFTIASGTPTLTAAYSATSASSCPPLGTLNPTQTSRRPIFFNQTANANHSTTTNFIAPYGSTLGYVVLTTNAAGSLPAGSSLTFQINTPGGSFEVPTFSIPSAQQANTTWIPINGIPASTIGITYVSGGASALTFNAYYLFLSPSFPNGLISPGIQPPTTLNSETVSAANTAIGLIVGSGQALAPTQRIHLFSVSARCSAGTSGLTIKDGSLGTTIWTTGPAEVGTTTFRYQWSPGLSTTLGNNLGITLATCGAANTGTLDVQASQF